MRGKVQSLLGRGGGSILEPTRSATRWRAGGFSWRRGIPVFAAGEPQTDQVCSSRDGPSISIALCQVAPLRTFDPFNSVLTEVAERAHATPSFLPHGVMTSLVTHSALLGGYSLYLLCASWWALPQLLPPRSGLQSRPQAPSRAIVLEATFQPLQQNEQRPVVTIETSSAEPAPPVVEAQELRLERLHDTPAAHYNRPLNHLEHPLRDPATAPRPDEGRERLSEFAPRVDQESPQSPHVARMSDGVQAETIKSVDSIASRESLGAETQALPHAIFSPEPTYPPEAYSQRIGGRVLIRVDLDSAGRVAVASVYRSCGVASLDQAALDAVRNWRFVAASDALPTARQFAVPIRFIPPEG